MKLKKLVEISTGYQVRRKIKNVDIGSHRIIQMRNINFENGILDSDVNCYDQITPNYPEKYLLKQNDIILLTRGNFNQSVLIDVNKENWLASGHFMVLRTKNSSFVLPEYLNIFLNLDSVKKYFQHEARGTSIKILNRKTVEELEITVPDISVQNKIIMFYKNYTKELDLLKRLSVNKQLFYQSALEQLIQK